MKKITITLMLLLVFTSSIADSKLPSYDSEREIFKEYLSTIEQALNQNDIDKITPLLKDDVVVVFVNAEVARGIPEVQNYYNKVLGGSNALLSDYSTKAMISAPARFSNNTAIADGSTTDTYTLSNGDIIEMDIIWNVTLIKEDISDRWKIAQLNFSANPFSNPIMSAVEQKMFLAIGISLLLGFVLGFFIKRSRKKDA